MSACDPKATYEDKFVSANTDEISRRENAARAHIDAIYGTPEDEHGATLYVSHHLSELDASYWIKHTGTSTPEAQQVLRILELRIDPDEEELDGEEEELDILDFSLPDGATDYVISVEFDDSGNIAGVSMES